MELVTAGHGTLSEHDLGALLTGAGMATVVDVRTAPGSRRHPHVNRSFLETHALTDGARLAGPDLLRYDVGHTQGLLGT